MFLITTTTKFIKFDGCFFENISTENLLYEISSTVLYINQSNFFNISSLNTYVIYIYSGSQLFLKGINSNLTSNGFLNVKDVDFSTISIHSIFLKIIWKIPLLKFRKMSSLTAFF